jgi:hypothetical protein
MPDNESKGGGGGRGWFRQRGEFTDVSMETEVRIPWQTWKALLILGPVSIWALWFAGSTLWLGYSLLNDVKVWAWLSQKWWPWMGRWWWCPLFFCFLWWATAPTWNTIYRFMVETFTKSQPMYDNWNPANGAWHPFVNWRRRRIERAQLDQTYYEKFGRGSREDREDD